MDYQEFKNAMETLERVTYHLEEAYTENEGEVTEETEQMEAEIEAVKELLNSDGVDFLGRWLKGKEDKKKALKAEKDYVSRQIQAVDNTIDFIKEQICKVMEATGCEKVRGALGYSFATSISTKTEVDKDVLRDLYQERVEFALRTVIPSDVTVTLGASVSRLPADAELPAYYKRTSTPTVRFSKPRKSKEDE